MPAPFLSGIPETAVDRDRFVVFDLSTIFDDAEDGGAGLSYQIVSPPSQGAASISGTALTFDPVTSASGPFDGPPESISMTIRATDSDSNVVETVFSVLATPAGTNDAPVSFG